MSGINEVNEGMDFRYRESAVEVELCEILFTQYLAIYFNLSRKFLNMKQQVFVLPFRVICYKHDYDKLYDAGRFNA